MLCERSRSVIVVEPAALAGFISSYPAVPVKLRMRKLPDALADAHHTRPAKTSSVLPVTWGKTRAVAAAVLAGVKVTVRTSPGLKPVPGLVSVIDATN